MTSFRSELSIYLGRVGEFSRRDWWLYLTWVGLILGLVGATGGFLLVGHLHGVSFPAEAWLVPAGAAVFAVAISVDTVGHLTI